MEFIQQIDGVLLFILLFSGLLYLDKRFSFGLASTTCHGDMSDLLSGGEGAQRSNGKSNAETEQQIALLKERIEVLEQIVTDPKEQLRREINSL